MPATEASPVSMAPVLWIRALSCIVSAPVRMTHAMSESASKEKGPAWVLWIRSVGSEVWRLKSRDGVGNGSS